VQDDTNDWAHHHVLEFLSKRLNRPPESFGLDELLMDLNVDSLDWVELVMALEDEVDLSLLEPAQGEIRTVGDLVRWVRNAK
jgi:acyl carrier protein